MGCMTLFSMYQYQRRKEAINAFIIAYETLIRQPTHLNRLSHICFCLFLFISDYVLTSLPLKLLSLNL